MKINDGDEDGMILDLGATRHVLMRLGLGFVLCWFAAQELRTPSEWTVFVPGFVEDTSPVALDQLVLLHGFLLLLAGTSVVLGLLYLPGCLLAVALVLEIIFGLWWDEGVNDLVVRDIGLFVLAVGLAADPVRSWRLDNLLPKAFEKLFPDRVGAATAKSGRFAWQTTAGAGAGLLALVMIVAFALNAAGSQGESLPGGSVAALSNSSATSPQASPGASAGRATTPTPAPSVRFADWRYKQYAFQIYPGEISAEAKKALAGFQLNVEDQGDTVLVLLKATSARYKDAQYTVDKRDTAYFIETSMRDDPNDQENNLRDDGVIDVNPQGFIVNS